MFQKKSKLSANETAFSIHNSLLAYKYLIFFCMLYIVIMLCNSILTNRYVSLDKDIFVLGGTLTSPFIFILGDIIAEIYGYKISKQIILCGFFCQALFAFVCYLIVHAPYPPVFKHEYAYSLIFGELPYIVFSSFLAFIIAGLLNVFIITQWKILLLGKHFWLRSLGSSTLAEALYSGIAIIMMEINSISTENMWKVVLTSYLIKVIYSIIFAAPANLLVNYIKRTAKIDVFDTPENFNPFRIKAHQSAFR